MTYDYVQQFPRNSFLVGEAVPSLSPYCLKGEHKWSDITIGGNQICLRSDCTAEKKAAR